jgi:hypothetical protein
VFCGLSCFSSRVNRFTTVSLYIMLISSEKGGTMIITNVYLGCGN